MRSIALTLGIALASLSWTARAADPAPAAATGDAAADEAAATKYEQEAEEAKAEAEKHRKMAQDFKAQKGPQVSKWKLDVHCMNLAKYYDQIAKTKSAMAAAYRKAAK